MSHAQHEEHGIQTAIDSRTWIGDIGRDSTTARERMDAISSRIDNAHAALCGWLNRADDNYLGGRLLARSGAPLVGGNLFWLAIEQLCKVLILQGQLERLPLPEHSPSQRSKDIEKIHEILECEAKRIRPYHKAQPLVSQLAIQTPQLDLGQYQPMLSILEQFFSERYYQGLSYKFFRDDLGIVDALYFDLREHVALDIGMGTIDVACLLRTNNKPFLRHVEVDLFEDNKALRPRPGCWNHRKFEMGWAGLGMRVAETLRFSE